MEWKIQISKGRFGLETVIRLQLSGTQAASRRTPESRAKQTSVLLKQNPSDQSDYCFLKTALAEFAKDALIAPAGPKKLFRNIQTRHGEAFHELVHEDFFHSSRPEWLSWIIRIVGFQFKDSLQCPFGHLLVPVHGVSSG